MTLVERIVEAGQPLNPEQLRVLLAGCQIYVTVEEAVHLFTVYGSLTTLTKKQTFCRV